MCEQANTTHPTCGSSSIQAIIFDLDGVLVDTHPVHRANWKRLLQSLSVEVSEKDLAFVEDGRKREDIIRHFIGEVSAKEAQHIGAMKDLLYMEHAEAIQLTPGVGEFLSKAREAGVALAVASSARSDRLAQTLKAARIREFFSVEVSGSEVVHGKPDPEIFLLAASRLRVPAQSAVVFEDAVSGIQAARAAGMMAIGVSANGKVNDLMAAGASTVVQDLRNMTLQTLQKIRDVITAE